MMRFHLPLGVALSTCLLATTLPTHAEGGFKEFVTSLLRCCAKTADAIKEGAQAVDDQLAALPNKIHAVAAETQNIDNFLEQMSGIVQIAATLLPQVPQLQQAVDLLRAGDHIIDRIITRLREIENQLNVLPHALRLVAITGAIINGVEEIQQRPGGSTSADPRALDANGDIPGRGTASTHVVSPPEKLDDITIDVPPAPLNATAAGAAVPFPGDDPRGLEVVIFGKPFFGGSGIR